MFLGFTRVSRLHAISASMPIRAVKVVYDRAEKYRDAGEFSRKNKIFSRTRPAEPADVSDLLVSTPSSTTLLYPLLSPASPAGLADSVAVRAHLCRYCLVAFHRNSLKRRASSK